MAILHPRRAKPTGPCPNFGIAGVATNIAFLRGLLRSPAFANGDMHTRFVEQNAAALFADATEPAPTEKAGDGSGLEGIVAVPAPLQGTIVSIAISAGNPVRKGEAILIMESMKMEHVIASPVSGMVRAVHVSQGDTVFEDRVLAIIEPMEVSPGE